MFPCPPGDYGDTCSPSKASAQLAITCRAKITSGVQCFGMRWHTEEADALRTSGEALHLDEAEVHGSEDLTALLNTSGDRNGSTGTARAHRTAATMNRLFMPLNSPRGCGGVMALVIRPLRVAATKKLAQPGTDRQRTVQSTAP